MRVTDGARSHARAAAGRALPAGTRRAAIPVRRSKILPVKKNHPASLEHSGKSAKRFFVRNCIKARRSIVSVKR